MAPRRPLTSVVPAPLVPWLALPLVATACASTPEARPGAAAPANAVTAPAAPGGERLTFEALYDPKKRVDFQGRPASPIHWIDGAHWLESRANATTQRTEWVIVDARTGRAGEPLDASKAQAAIAKIPGVTADDARRLATFSPASTNADRSALLVSAKGDLWVVRFDRDTPVRLTDTPDVEEEEATFSPDGLYVAYVAQNDLWIADTKVGGRTRVTNDGVTFHVVDGASREILNGKLDWLYQEEVYGRGTFRAFWWSPDSSSIAFLRLDETGVPPYTLVDDATHVPTVETSPYPRPGEPNPTVKLGVARVGGTSDERTTWVDLSAYAASEPLVVDVSWSPKNELVYCVQDREQTWLDLRVAARDGTRDRRLLRETSPAWVDRNDAPPRWLADGSFLWSSERTGFKHLYHYRVDPDATGDAGVLVRALTSGEWEVRELHGVDEAKGVAYVSGTDETALGSDAFAVALDGRTPLRKLTTRAGTHGVTFSPDFGLFVDTWSDLWTPPQTRLHANDGSLVRVIDESGIEALGRFALAKPELVTVPTRDGFTMNGMLLKPLDFDPAKRYPVLMFVYAGPHSQTVRNAWSGANGLFQQLVAQRGVIVWSCDNRSASGKGARSAWTAYRRLGVGELADIEDSLDWLAKQGFVDESRIGITGWSYGGFMTSYALTHSKRFALGIAGGSVTDWRSYDSIYTERLMKLPKNNAEGYDATSVVKAAADLHGKLVLVHGQIDENVHPQNTMRLVHALQKANADFDLMLYPQSRHGVRDRLLNRHWRALTLRAIDEHLR